MIINNIGRDSVFNMVTGSVKDPAERCATVYPIAWTMVSMVERSLTYLIKITCGELFRRR